MNIHLTPKRIALLAVLFLAIAPYFARLGASSLWDSNEAFYAETPREMIESGDWINPSFNYQPRFNKPPLCYWIVALFYKLFSVSETVERVTIALAALAIIAIAYKIGSEIFSLEAGLLAAICIAIAPRFLMFSRRIMIDVYLAMFMSASLLFFILAENRIERRRLYLALMYASVGLGILTKGPVAAVLPAAAFIIYLAINRRLGFAREMRLPMGLLIVAAITLPWYGIVYAQHGWHYIETFILKDNLSRYTEPIWGPRRSIFFYLPVLLGDMFPWSFFLIPVLWLAARGRMSRDENGAAKWTLPLIWIAVIVIFFSFSRNKEDLYILPAHPAAAVLIGGLLARFVAANQVDKHLSPARWTAAAIGAVLALAGGGALYVFARSSQAYRFDGIVFIGCVALLGGAVVIAASFARRKLISIIASAFVAVIINWVFVLKTLPDFERFKPARALTDVARRAASTDSLVGYYRVASPSMIFYLRRPIFEFYKQEELLQALDSGKEVYCLITASDYETIKPSLPVPIYILASRPMFQVKLKSILDEADPPQLMLISNKGGIEIEQ
jgi:4-amino-4-deoxy-L-arabinose transferase-like glycosyltransferase